MRRRHSQRPGVRASGGYNRALLIGGGCLAAIVIGIMGVLIAGSLLWDQTSAIGAGWVSDRISSEVGPKISERANNVDDVGQGLPEPRRFYGHDEYLRFLDANHQEFVGAMDEVGRLLSDPRLSDDDWADDMAYQIALIRYIEAQARETTAPEALADAHEHWVNGMSEFRRAMDSTATSLDDLSPTGIAEAIAAINNATRSYVSMAVSLRAEGVLDDLEAIRQLETVDQP